YSSPRPGMWLHDFKVFEYGKAMVARFNDESGNPARARRFAGAGKNDVKVGNAAVRNPVLLAVKDETISVAAGDSSDIRDIRPGRWFGQCKGGDTLAGSRFRQPCVPLLCTAEQGNRSSTEPLHGKCEIG